MFAVRLANPRSITISATSPPTRTSCLADSTRQNTGVASLPRWCVPNSQSLRSPLAAPQSRVGARRGFELRGTSWAGTSATTGKAAMFSRFCRAVDVRRAHPKSITISDRANVFPLPGMAAVYTSIKANDPFHIILGANCARVILSLWSQTILLTKHQFGRGWFVVSERLVRERRRRAQPRRRPGGELYDLDAFSI